jgi:hypothetical protein
VVFPQEAPRLAACDGEGDRLAQLIGTELPPVAMRETTSG